MANIQKSDYVKGLGQFLYIEAPFDQALGALESVGIKSPLSMEYLASARITSGKNSHLSQNGSYAKEGVIYTPEKRIFVRYSIIPKYAGQAVEAHKLGNQFYLDEKTAKDLIEKQKKGTILVLKNKDAVPTHRFADDEKTAWLFQDKAESYGLFLKDAGISQLSFYLSDLQKGRYFANQLWLRRLGNDSDVNGNYWNLINSYRLFGVSQDSAEGRAKSQAYKKPYSGKELTNAIKIAEGVKKGEIPASKLEKTIALLEKIQKE